MNKPQPFNLQDAVCLLLHRAESSLSVSELQGLARATVDATNQARLAAALANNVGCLIASDADAGNYAAADEVGRLLFHLGATFNTVAALSDLGYFAADALQRRGEPREGPTVAPAQAQTFAGGQA